MTDTERSLIVAALTRQPRDEALWRSSSCAFGAGIMAQFPASSEESHFGCGATARFETCCPTRMEELECFVNKKEGKNEHSASSYSTATEEWFITTIDPVIKSINSKTCHRLVSTVSILERIGTRSTCLDPCSGFRLPAIRC